MLEMCEIEVYPKRKMRVRSIPEKDVGLSKAVLKKVLGRTLSLLEAI